MVVLDCATPVKPLRGVCDCYFGADRCHVCAAECSKARHASDDCFSKLPDDALETIAHLCGKDLPRFASVNTAMRRLVQPALWRSAYEEAAGAAVTCGDALPPSMWKACLLKDKFCGAAPSAK